MDSSHSFIWRLTRRINRQGVANHKFGSAARNTIRLDSDLDLLVVVCDGVDRLKTAQEIYKSLRGLGFAKDTQRASN